MRFYVTDDAFKYLHGLDVKEFVDEFHLLLKRSQLRTLGPSEVPKARQRSQYKHTRTFWEEVELLRNLHPEKGLLGEDEMLNTAAKEWRRQAESALNVQEGHLGGLLKEAIAVACLSQRCFLWAESVTKAYASWKLKNQSNNKVNRMLFVQLPGLRDEEMVFHLLQSFRSGELNKLEFNEKLKEAKVAASRGKKRQLPALNETDSGSLKRRNALLEARIVTLQREMADLRDKLRTPETPATDVYTFHGSDDEDASLPSVTPPRSEDEEEALQTNETDSEEEPLSDDSISLLLPTITYSRNIGKRVCQEETEHRNGPEENGSKTDESNERVLLDTLSRLDERQGEECQHVEEEEGAGGRFFTDDEFSNLQPALPVWAQDDGEWFKAKVVKSGSKGVKVHYIGYGKQHEKTLGKTEVKTYRFSVGERVRARWEDGHLYRGTVKRSKEKVYTILFDDGVTWDTEDVTF
ncbi:uncharacterized protein LOC134244645 isoform X2 [Saccostrea cucullata]|uniref:uncharacterized protein LOC134244645 isoform X2 n=1 Tax=Saccostrea cuccullata TaxID=36930 RepID=UPI002ED4F2DC